MKKKSGIYFVMLLMTALSLSSCLSMITKMVTNAQQKQLKEQIKQYDKMAIDETNAARIAGTWRLITNTGVTVWSFSGDGKMNAAVQFLGKPANFIPAAYKVSTDTLAQRYHDAAFAQANPKLIADTVTFYACGFNDNYTELKVDITGAGLEFALPFTKINDEYMAAIDKASLDVPVSDSQTATLVWGHAWQQPIQLKGKYGNKTKFDFGTSSTTTIKINGKELAFSRGSLDLPEGEYEIYFGETVKVENMSTGYYGTVLIEKRSSLTARKGHVYEIKVLFDEENIARLSVIGVNEQSTWGSTVLLWEIPLEQYYAEYLQVE